MEAALAFAKRVLNLFAICEIQENTGESGRDTILVILKAAKNGHPPDSSVVGADDAVLELINATVALRSVEYFHDRVQIFGVNPTAPHFNSRATIRIGGIPK